MHGIKRRDFSSEVPCSNVDPKHNSTSETTVLPRYVLLFFTCLFLNCRIFRGGGGTWGKRKHRCAGQERVHCYSKPESLQLNVTVGIKWYVHFSSFSGFLRQRQWFREYANLVLVTDSAPTTRTFLPTARALDRFPNRCWDGNLALKPAPALVPQTRQR